MITQSELKALLHYNAEVGIFTWKVVTSNRVKVGDVAGHKHSDGYTGLTIHGTKYFAHRLAWLYVYGVYPTELIDHINGQRGDNRICNLREADRKQNAYNAKKHSTNTSGVKGVCWHKMSQKWTAYLHYNGVRYYLGLFVELHEAEQAIKDKRRELHGDFCNHGV